MGFIEINDFHTIFSERDGSVGQNILDCRNHIPDRLNLDRFYSQYVVCFIHPAFVS
jgi:hypothetical protein